MPRIPISLRVAWTKITVSNVTLVYFVYSVGHSVVQLSIQGKVFSVNDDAERFLFRIANTAGTAGKELPYLDGRDLRLCSQIPPSMDFNIDDCPVIWNEATGGPDPRFAAILDGPASSTTTLSSLLSSVLPSSTPLSLPSAVPTVTGTTPGSVITDTATFTVSSTPSATTSVAAAPTAIPIPPADDSDDGSLSIDSGPSSVDVAQGGAGLAPRRQARGLPSTRRQAAKPNRRPNSSNNSLSSFSNDDTFSNDSNSRSGRGGVNRRSLEQLGAPTKRADPRARILRWLGDVRSVSDGADAVGVPPAAPSAAPVAEEGGLERRQGRSRSRASSNNSRNSINSINSNNTNSSRGRRGPGRGRGRLAKRQRSNSVSSNNSRNSLNSVSSNNSLNSVSSNNSLNSVNSLNSNSSRGRGRRTGVIRLRAEGSEEEEEEGRALYKRQRNGSVSSNNSRNSRNSLNSISSNNSSRGRRGGRARVRLSKRQRSNSVSSNNSRNSVNSVSSNNSLNSLNSNSSRGRRGGRARVRLSKRQRSVSSNNSRNSRNSVNSINSLNSNSSRGRRGGRARVRLSKRQRSNSVSSNNSRNSINSVSSNNSLNSLNSNSSRGRRVGRVRTRLSKRQRSNSVSSNNSIDSINSLNSVSSNNSLNSFSSNNSISSNSSRGRGRRVDAIVLKRDVQEIDARQGRGGRGGGRNGRGGRRGAGRVNGVARPRAAVAASTLPVDGAEAVKEFLNKRQEQSSNGGFRTFNVQLQNGESANVNEVCLLAANYPLSIAQNTRREDIVFIAFQFWVLLMSVVALLNESVPYLLASFLSHAMATVWSAFQVAHTAYFRARFNRVITNGACAGVNLLPKYWVARRSVEVPSLVFNFIGMFVFGVLTWKLFKSFGMQTLRRMGVSNTMSKIYKLVLSFGVTIRLGVFFMAVQLALWVDQLFNSPVGNSVSSLDSYKATSLVTLVLLVPWLITGWVAVKRELRIPMILFVLFGVLYVVEWGFMIFTTSFRFTFLSWKFFSVLSAAAFGLTCLTVVLGIACYIQFGKGFVAYLAGTERPLSPEEAGHPAFIDHGSSLYGRSEKSSEKNTFSDIYIRGPSPPPTFVLHPGTPSTHEYPFNMSASNRDSKFTQGSNGYSDVQSTKSNVTGTAWSFLTPRAPADVPAVPAVAVASERPMSTKTYSTWSSFFAGSERPATQWSAKTGSTAEAEKRADQV